MHLRRILGSIFSRANIVPAMCYNECNNAMLTAETSGKNPALCAPNSTFFQLENACLSCVAADNGAGSGNTSLGYLSQLVEYCSNISMSASSNTLLQSILTEEAVISSLEAKLTSFELASTTSTLVVSTTTSHASPGPTSSLPTISNVPARSSLPQSKTWMIGLVVGVIALLVASGFGIHSIRKRRKDRMVLIKEGPYEGIPDKAQLHSDFIPRKNLSELKGSDPRVYAELPAIEPAASELATNN